MLNVAKQTHERDAGYVLILTALLMVPLMMVTGLAVDLGSWYARASQLQKTADAASLAGVVRMPDLAAAETAARAVLAKNGFPDSDSNNVVDTDSDVQILMEPGSGNGQFRVTLTDNSAPLFFARILLGNSQVKIARRATAESVTAVPLGSPGNVMGNNMPAGCVDPTAACAGAQPQLWSAIQGPYESHVNGDPYTTKCNPNDSGSTCDNGSFPTGHTNPQFRNTGYLFAVDVPQSVVDAGGTVNVQLYDASNSTSSYTQDSNSGSFHTYFELFKSDGSDFTVSTDPSLSMSTNSRCNSPTPGKLLTASETSYKDSWTTLCTFQPTVAGIYPLRVQTSGIPGVSDAGAGWNAFSVRATGASGVSVYALNDMSIWTPTAGTTARFYLANIGTEQAGKTLQIDLYDPGDVDCASGFSSCGSSTMQFLMPPSGTPTVPPTGSGTATSCKYGTGTANAAPSSLPNTSANCTITTDLGSSSSQYNGLWLRLQISIPSTYSCTTDCWWTVTYQFGLHTKPTDRTVWTVNVLGDPVHLVE